MTQASTLNKPESAISDPLRLDELYATGLLDSPPEESFDRFTRLANDLLGIPLTLVTLVDKDRQFFKSQVGLDAVLAEVRQTSLDRSFCKHVVESGEPLIVEDARENSLLRDNPAVQDGAIAYLGMPLITHGGQTLGTFCAVNDQPHRWSKREIRIMRDLATTMMKEIELRLIGHHLFAQYNSLRSIELQRDEMAQMLVHDLRNPLSSLLAGLTLIEEADTLHGDQLLALEVAKRGGEALLKMVNEILEVSKMEAGHVTLDLEDVVLPDLLAIAVEQVDNLARRARIRIDIESDQALPACRLDAEKIRRVLVNLLANAIQHTAPGGRVLLSLRRFNDTQIEVRVSDNGLGIASQQLDRIFSKYNSAGTARHLGSSTGLGLSFCKLVIEAHGGDIRVESQLGEGSSFIVRLPAGLSDAS